MFGGRGIARGDMDPTSRPKPPMYAGISVLDCLILCVLCLLQLADIDGPFIVVRLVGRFWHKRAGMLLV